MTGEASTTPTSREAPKADLIRSVTDFVAPLFPTGSLNASFTLRLDEDAMALGARLHARIQRRLAREHPGALCETAVDMPLRREGFTCLVRGRLDAFLPGDPGILEEIKTTAQPGVLLKALAAEPDHVFAQQARMYAWILGQQGRAESVECRLRVVSLLDEAETLVPVSFEPGAFSTWVEGQLQALHEAHLQALARAEARRELGTRLAFPFDPPRVGQPELMDLVRGALETGKPLLVQAPTGLGKTAAMLHPVLGKALGENLRVFYATPRNSQHAVAEAFVRRLRAQGLEVRSVTLRAKERVCPQEEVHCHPEACPRAKDYYDRLRSSGVLDELMEVGCADGPAITEAADRHLLCPFELSLDAAVQADVVIGDYNYVLSPHAAIHRFFGSPEQAKRNLVLLDEAHNLPGRATDWFSPTLEVAALKALKKVKGPPSRSLKGHLSRQIGRCLRVLEALDGAHRRLDLDPEPLLAEEVKIRALATRAALEGVPLTPSHPLVQLFRMWGDFCGVLREATEPLVTWIPPGRLQITCPEASEHLGARLQGLAHATLFSATLKPFDHYAQLSGLDPGEVHTAEVPSPFPAANRCLLVVPQLSTLFRRRATEIPRVADFLNRILPLRHGNYLVFFPSFDFLEKCLPHLHLPTFRILAQPRRASQAALGELLEALRTERGLAVLAVQGGSLSEGIDLPGEALIGAVVVGPPLPPFDLERQLVRDHLQTRFGDGDAYTYTYPAMARAVQAAGRVIRGPGDRGLLVFLDPRFLDPTYAQCFPRDWFQESPRECVSTSLIADIQRFWG